MTRYLVDVASYQGVLKPVDVKEAGFDIVNIKTSHGLTRKSVHPDAADWVTNARTLGLELSSFHWLTGDTTGAAQAEYAYARLADLDLLWGTAHIVDVESASGITEAIVRGYLTRMIELLGRPIGLYTGDWYWPMGWNVTALASYLMAAPNNGYPGRYRGDTSADWSAHYGGWTDLAIQQYAVSSLPGGSIDVSKSAIRDPAVWADLTRGRPGMSYAPATIVAARSLILKNLPKIDPLSVGIIGDDSHAQTGTSYHLGKDALRSDAYSITESPRDRDGLTNAASALDIGVFTSGAHNLRTFSSWLVAQCVAGTPDTQDIREVIYSLDGVSVHRWDRLKVRTSGPTSHLYHTHISYFRDSEDRDKTALFRRYFTFIGLMGNDMPLDSTDKTWLKSAEFTNGIVNAVLAYKIDPTNEINVSRTLKTFITDVQNLRDALVHTLDDTRVKARPLSGGGFDKLMKSADMITAQGQLLSALIKFAQDEAVEIPPAADVIADAVLGELQGQTLDETAAALVAVLGPDKAAALGALLAG
jgi:hypothetical protein